MSLFKAQDAFELAFTTKWREYLELHKQLDQYRGVDLEHKFEEVNVIIAKITETMLELHPSFEFIIKRTKMSHDAIKHYNDFIESIKMVGAIEHTDANA